MMISIKLSYASRFNADEVGLGAIRHEFLTCAKPANMKGYKDSMEIGGCAKM